MKIFPTKVLEFKLIDSQEQTLNRLQRRTEISENLVSKYTDKSFIGTIKENEFKIITSTIGIGAFSVMTGNIDIDNGTVHVAIHKAFQILLSIISCLPIIAFLATLASEIENIQPYFILVVIGQILIIRYVFIGLAFKYLSRQNLNRLRSVLDVEWIHN